MDGTFSVVPRLYGQLFTIHAFDDTTLLPLVYVLMANKTTALYTSVFQDLKAQCQQVGPFVWIITKIGEILTTVTKQ
jgi:hypothetical protein